MTAAAPAAAKATVLAKRMASRQLGPVRDRSRRKLETILDAAEGLLADRAFDEISIQDIARAAQVNRTTIYNFFESASEIFKAVSRRTIVTAEQDIRAAIVPAAGDDVLRRMEMVIDAVCAFLNTHPVAAKCMFSDSRYDAYLVNDDFEAVCSSFPRAFVDPDLIARLDGREDPFRYLGFVHSSFFSRSIRAHGVVTDDIVAQIKIFTRGYLREVLGLG